MAKIDKKYHVLLRKIVNKGFKYEDPNRKGTYRIQIPNHTFKHNFDYGFPAITTKKLYWKGVVGELIWFLRGDTNIKYLVDNGINIWNKDAYNYYLKECENLNIPKGEREIFNDWLSLVKQAPYREGSNYGNLGRVYGAQWRDWNKPYEINGLDQISNLIKGLKENPMGTRHIVTAWNPAELNDMALPPCHWSFEILVEPIYENKRYNDASNLGLKKPEYKFTLKWHQRSVDTFLGLPFNIASYALLAQIIGKLTNMIPKGIIGDLSNVHIYEPHLDAVREQLSRDVDGHKECELVCNSNIKYDYDKGKSLTNTINDLDILDFELLKYESYPRIPAEMLAYNK
jgi:thymidylate synthase